MDPLAKLAKDAAYVAVGFGVLGFQRAQVRRREVLKRLDDQRGRIEEFLNDSYRQAGEVGGQLLGRSRGG
ncbi:MAG TPA: hypothetical protein VGF64_03135 [Acidimicrobiales bacterium]